MPAEVMLPADLEPDRLRAFHDLLRALEGTLDVRSVFRQVSRIATRIIPHDEAALALLNVVQPALGHPLCPVDQRRHPPGMPAQPVL